MDKLLIFVKKQKNKEEKKTLILDQKHPHLLQYSSQKEKKHYGIMRLPARIFVQPKNIPCWNGHRKSKKN